MTLSPFFFFFLWDNKQDYIRRLLAVRLTPTDVHGGFQRLWWQRVLACLLLCVCLWCASLFHADCFGALAPQGQALLASAGVPPTPPDPSFCLTQIILEREATKATHIPGALWLAVTDYKEGPDWWWQLGSSSQFGDPDRGGLGEWGAGLNSKQQTNKTFQDHATN